MYIIYIIYIYIVHKWSDVSLARTPKRSMQFVPLSELRGLLLALWRQATMNWWVGQLFARYRTTPKPQNHHLPNLLMSERDWEKQGS